MTANEMSIPEDWLNCGKCVLCDTVRIRRKVNLHVLTQEAAADEFKKLKRTIHVVCTLFSLKKNNITRCTYLCKISPRARKKFYFSFCACLKFLILHTDFKNKMFMLLD